MPSERPLRAAMTLTEAEWWEEDAKRHNDLCDQLKKAGATVDVKEGPSPALNSDGSTRVEP